MKLTVAMDQPVCQTMLSSYFKIVEFQTKSLLSGSYSGVTE